MTKPPIIDDRRSSNLAPIVTSTRPRNPQVVGRLRPMAVKALGEAEKRQWPINPQIVVTYGDGKTYRFMTHRDAELVSRWVAKGRPFEQLPEPIAAGRVF